MTGVDANRPLACPICRGCSYDIAGLLVTDACPRCHRPIWATRARRAIRPACHRCGYDLAGLRVTDACPECGLPIWQTYELLRPAANTGAQVSGLAVASVALAIVGGLTAIVSGSGAVIYAGPALGLPGLVTGIIALPGSDDDRLTFSFCCASLGIALNLVLALAGVVLILIAKL